MAPVPERLFFCQPGRPRAPEDDICAGLIVLKPDAFFFYQGLTGVPSSACFKKTHQLFARDAVTTNQIVTRSNCKYPAKTNHSLSEIFRHIQFASEGDRYA